MTNLETAAVDKQPASANSQAEIERRVRQGQISPTGPLMLMTGRSFFMIPAQGLVAGIYWLRGHPSAWNAAAPWWTVYGTLVDVGCLALMVKFTRPEGIRLRDLIGRVRLRWGYDILLGMACFVVFLQAFSLPGLLAGKLIFGSAHPAMYPGLLAARRFFIPFILDWKYLVWRFLFFFPGAVIIALIYLRIRRLSPLILAHWPMDLMAVVYTLKF